MHSNNTLGARAPVGLVVMLSLALMINYIDRGAIATAAPLLQQELSLSPSEIGWVLAVFYWAYAPMQPVMGWLADRIGPALIMAVGLALWSLATAATGLVVRPDFARHPAPGHGRGRGGVLPERPEPPFAQCPGHATRPRHGDDAVRRGGRAGARHAGRRHDHAGVRLARDVRGHGVAVAHLAAVLAQACQRRTGRRRRRARRAGPAAGRSAVLADPQAAGAVGRHDGHVLLQLRVLLRLFLAAAVPVHRARPLDHPHDARHDGVLRR